jgi:hypothetical protein
MLVESLQAQDKELELRKEEHWKVHTNSHFATAIRNLLMPLN